MKKLLLATNNKGKVYEANKMLSFPNIQLLTPADLDIKIDPEEIGKTFVENAAIKAREFAKLVDFPVVADDSGLEIFALDGFPGVKSARWLKGTDSELIQGILSKMKNIKDRRAKFVSVIVFYDKSRNLEAIFEGNMLCEIAHKPSGNQGFGYDPIMLIPRFGKTTAQISADEKNQISHRGKSLKKLAQFLKSYEWKK